MPHLVACHLLFELSLLIGCHSSHHRRPLGLPLTRCRLHLLDLANQLVNLSLFLLVFFTKLGGFEKLHLQLLLMTEHLNIILERSYRLHLLSIAFWAHV